MRVKGTMVLDYVKIVRANRDKNWDQYLEPGDWEIIDGQVLPSVWYPYEFFMRIGYAVFKEVAGSNLEVAREFGKGVADGLIQVYKGLTEQGDPAEAVERLAKLRRIFMDVEGDSIVVGKGPGWIKVGILAPEAEKDSEMGLAYFNQVSGTYERLAERAGGVNMRSSMELTDGGCEIKVEWD